MVKSRMADGRRNLIAERLVELRALAQVFGVRYASLLSTPAVYRRGGRP